MKALLEEICPFVFYYVRARRLQKAALDREAMEQHPNCMTYLALEASELTDRIEQEHSRGKDIDEKTSKFTLTFGLVMSLVASVNGFFLNNYAKTEVISWILVLLGIASVFGLISGVISSRALTTLPTFGFGTIYELIKNDPRQLSIALISQEKINALRQLRNEAAYQCLRNGFICMIAALLVYVCFVAYEKIH